jgi:hypothetical protein
MNSSIINTFVMGVLAMLVRQALLTLVGALGLAPLIQPYLDANMTQFTQFSLAVAGGIVVVGYAGYKKFLDKQKLVMALSEANRSEKAIEVMLQDKLVTNPSVLTPKHEVPT